MNHHRISRVLGHESLEDRKMLDGSGIAAGEPVSDFGLFDVNPTSPSHLTRVSPSDFEGTAAYYFIHST